MVAVAAGVVGASDGALLSPVAVADCVWGSGDASWAVFASWAGFVVPETGFVHDHAVASSSRCCSLSR